MIIHRIWIWSVYCYFYHQNCSLIEIAFYQFIDKRSTCTNLLACFNDWTLALQDHCGVNVVYIDFAKAFDSVSYVKLIHRLKSYGIGDPLLQWIQNFLFDRSRCTRVGNVLSDFIYLISGVVQGSGLGLLLFVLYINELAEILRTYGITVRLFADDLKMYAKILNPVDAEVLQMAVDRLDDWAESWQMKISITKCNYDNW